MSTLRALIGTDRDASRSRLFGAQASRILGTWSQGYLRDDADRFALAWAVRDVLGPRDDAVLVAMLRDPELHRDGRLSAAIAARCRTALVEPPLATTAVAALRSDFAVT